MDNPTEFLFARPSFLEGMARVLDLGGTLNEYNRSGSAEEADLRALGSDWNRVGDAIRGAMKEMSHGEEVPPRAR